MKKGILCILLSLLLLAPMFASCQQEADFTETEARIYTLYTIVDESTTPEAIQKVELALNRILFYRLGVILKLEMVTEDQYDKLIEDKFAEVEAYQLEKKNSNKKNNSSVASGDETSVDVISGDDVLDLLEDGKGIPLEKPRLDIFLVKGYDDYYELASNGMLADIDTQLSNEAKALKSSIHSTLFTAAKVNKKTYGVPVNNAIGEYTYLVFDKELLAKYGKDPNTLKTMQDLQDYLEVIKANEPDVVPLKGAKVSNDLNFLSNEGFPALINISGDSREVIDAYKNENFKNYFAMIARYQALGYLSDKVGEEAEDGTRYAVRIETGNEDSISKSLKDTGYEYDYTLYSAPLATNETTIDNIFCLSKYVVSDEKTDVMKIMTAINTDPVLMNLLTYGVENEHYVLDDEGQVERLNNNYIIDPNHAGNCFITYTLKGENPEKWNNDIKQNQDAIVSPSLGFTSSLTEFEHKEYEEVPDPKNPDKTIRQENVTIVYEPDYIQIINKVVDKYYPALLAGNAVELDYSALLAKATEEVTEEFVDRLNDTFEENFLKPMFQERMEKEITAKKGAAILKTVTEDVTEEYYSQVKKNLKKKLESQFKKENPDASEDDILAMVNEVLTDEYVEEHFTDYYTKEDLEETIQETYLIELEVEIEDAIDEISSGPEYDREFNKLKNSDEYKSRLEDVLKFDAPPKIISRVDEFIAEAMVPYTENMIAEMNTEIEAAINAFIEENSEYLGLSRDEMLCQMGYLEVEKPAEEGEESGDAAPAAAEDEAEGEGEGEGEGETEIKYVTKYTSWFEFVFKEKLEKVYFSLYPNPTAA